MPLHGLFRSGRASRSTVASIPKRSPEVNKYAVRAGALPQTHYHLLIGSAGGNLNGEAAQSGSSPQMAVFDQAL